MEAMCITIEEAAKLSCIGINLLREITQRKDCPFVLWIRDTKRVIKVKEFQEWISKTERVA